MSNTKLKNIKQSADSVELKINIGKISFIN